MIVCCIFVVFHCNFHSHAVHLDTVKVLLPTDAQEKCFKRSIKIYNKAAPTLINFRFQLMHYNFISLIILLYMFPSLTYLLYDRQMR